MALVALNAADRPDLSGGDGIGGKVWPEYNLHGDVVEGIWDELYDLFPECQFVLRDDQRDETVAAANSIPCVWDGTTDGLPGGVDGAVEDGLALGRAGGAATGLSAIAIMVAPEHQGEGLSSRMIGEMGAIARAQGLGTLIAPVRPTWKERYSLAPIERYAYWKREDGLPFDPWMRVHARLGAEILRPEPRSLRITGTVAEWEGWTEMSFPESDEYVFPRGLAPVTIDRERDRGLYFEPNVWMEHPLDAG